MKTLVLTCKLITPMFMAGADGKSPELRPSEFKGMMRWWWRAIKSENNINELRKEEAEIFGGAGENQGKSKVKIKILSQLQDRDEIFEYQLLPHRHTFKLKAVKPGKEIKIEFSMVSQIENEVKNLIYLSFILGGFGRRSRRGFGSMELIDPKIEISLEELINLLTPISNKYKIANSGCANGIKAICNYNNNQKGAKYPWIREIILSNKNFNNYDEILKAIGSASHCKRDLSLGNANPRMSSPVYVSVVRTNNKLRPIITVLNSEFPPNYPKINVNKQKEFIEMLL